MPDRFAALTAFVLAGGASRRMGRPKHELVLDGETLLARMLRIARAVARRAIVLGPPDRVHAHDVSAIADELPGHGPLGAIYTGLRRTRTDFNLFLSCDMPFMRPRFLRYLATRSLATGADATLAVTPDEEYQPLAAIYRRRSLPAVRRSLARGRNKMTSFLHSVDVLILRWPELVRAGFQASIFDNLNTVEDYARARRRLEGTDGRSQCTRS